MANVPMPDEFFDAVALHLSPEQPVRPKGGRPRIGNQVVVRVIWFVLTTGARWEDVPPELGCSGRTAHRRLRAWEEAGIWGRLHAGLLAALKRAGKLDLDTVIIDGVTVRAFGGGEATGPSPVDPWVGGSGSDQGRCTFRPPVGYPAGPCTITPPFRDRWRRSGCGPQ
jgi:transposase